MADNQIVETYKAARALLRLKGSSASVRVAGTDMPIPKNTVLDQFRHGEQFGLSPQNYDGENSYFIWSPEYLILYIDGAI